MMWKYLIILVGTFLLISCSIQKARKFDLQSMVRQWEETVFKSIDKEIYYVINKCPSLISGVKKNFYRSELDFFPVESTFSNINQLADDLRLKEKTDTIVLVLFYPFVGFDPLDGYERNFTFKEKGMPLI